jgi:hypothetical protein
MHSELNQSELRFGVQECLQRDLLRTLPIYRIRSKDSVAQFKTTAIVTTEGTLRLGNVRGHLPYVHSRFNLGTDLQAALEEPRSDIHTLPFSKEIGHDMEL